MFFLKMQIVDEKLITFIVWQFLTIITSLGEFLWR